MTGTFKEKFDKVYQSYKNICEQKISEDSMFDANKETYIRFFQDCFHLKDWLRNDETIQSKRAKGNIEIYINNSNYLKFTADIANASKHKKIDFKIRVDKEIEKKNSIIARAQLYDSEEISSLLAVEKLVGETGEETTKAISNFVRNDPDYIKQCKK